jgi:hypothetical protein
VLRADFEHDLLGRLKRQVDYGVDGSAAYDRSVQYNSKNQATAETVTQKRGTETWQSVISHDYGAGGDYRLGAVAGTTSAESKLVSGGYQLQHTATTVNTHAWREGAVLTSAATSGGPTASTAYHHYDAWGDVSEVQVRDGAGTLTRHVNFTTDMTGQVIRRSEGSGVYAQPLEVHYRFAGKEMGVLGNNGTLDTDYASSIADRTRAPSTGPFRTDSYDMHIDFGLGPKAINSYSQGGAGGSYEARAGDTLAGIAAMLWGDSSLWYKLAEANGLGAAATLSEGQRLTIPAGVQRNTHNASTFRPYDPAEMLGDLSPVNPRSVWTHPCV